MYDRSQDFGWIASDKGFLPYVTGIKKLIFQKIAAKKLQSQVSSQTWKTKESQAYLSVQKSAAATRLWPTDAGGTWWGCQEGFDGTFHVSFKKRRLA